MYTLGWTDDDGLELFTLAWYLSFIEEAGIDTNDTFRPTFSDTFIETYGDTFT